MCLRHLDLTVFAPPCSPEVGRVCCLATPEYNSTGRRKYFLFNLSQYYIVYVPHVEFELLPRCVPSQGTGGERGERGGGGGGGGGRGDWEGGRKEVKGEVGREGREEREVGREEE